MDDLEKNNKKNLPSKNNSKTIKKPGCLITTFAEKTTYGERVRALLRRTESPIAAGIREGSKIKTKRREY